MFFARKRKKGRSEKKERRKKGKAGLSRERNAWINTRESGVAEKEEEKEEEEEVVVGWLVRADGCGTARE